MRLQPSHRILTLTALTWLATAVACGGGGAPELNGLTDHVAQVGTELVIDLNGTDPDGDKLEYGFRAADLTDLGDRASISVSPSGAGVFRWTPNAMDLGEHAFDFTASDGDNTTTVTITIDVRSAIGSATAPVFRQPLGTGTTLDLSKKECLDLAIVVEDQDTAQVTLSQQDPIIEGAELIQEGGLNATWHWCPTRDQQAESRYTLTLAADDGDNPTVLKNYLVVLRSGTGGTNCPGSAPSISHTPTDETTVVDLTIDAQVSDDKGLKESPLFYYSLTNPGTTPDLGAMTQLSTLQISGSNTNGVYAADVPNPVANEPAGTSQTIYYVFVADDDDDEAGSCDHTTVSQVYSMTVTSSGPANLPLCAACSSDNQCGSGDLCVYVGSLGNSYCMQSCAGGCPSGYSCSAEPVYSVDWNSAKQCVPINGSCEMPNAPCEDDLNEDDDDRSQASANAMIDGPLQPSTIFAVSCPKPVQPTSGSKADDDYRQLKITADTRVDLYLSGDGNSDLDLQIYNSSGSLVSKSTTLQAEEYINKCLPPATYYVKVNGFTNARSEYLLEYRATAETCDTTCVDDSREDDDTFTQARAALVTGTTYSSTDNQICRNDDDYYRVNLLSGEKLVMDLTFTQTDPSGDLDLHLHDSFGDLWPCSYEDPTMCSPTRGQGAVSNEHAEFTAPAGCGTGGCDYWVVVSGYNGARNAYSINLKIQ